MANKSRMIDFNKERLYEALRMNDIDSVKALCDDKNDSLCYGGHYVSRKTIERACQTGKISSRTLYILSRALDCTPEFFTAPDVIVKDIVNVKHVVYLSDGRQAMFYAAYAEEPYRSNNETKVLSFYNSNDDLMAEFKSACVLGWMRL